MAKHQGLSNNDLMQAALDGDLEATYQLGCRFLTGSHGVSVNAAQAIKWLQKAADEGHSDAQTNLGSCYMHGRGVPPSADKAVKMYRKASAKKNINGMYNLGVCYRNGLGVKEDCDVAIQWFYKSAVAGHSAAQNNLGVLYEKGSGLTIVQDLETAVMWYGRAAKQGHPYGMFNLATCYAHARGVEQDQVLAYKWLSAASEHGHQDAQEVLARIPQYVQEDMRQQLASRRSQDVELEELVPASRNHPSTSPLFAADEERMEGGAWKQGGMRRAIG
ncbi:hypothetical protein CYMTET_34866 [Cymbomonas tetramitiformis]|uniref:Uncharacterized protein n=1 Tax=Cymbomonas tetramitiformis TaxID=36881 RepID=A0AAE0KPI7_9CHLO|nr:hypothetical protein CYMTET_34866 [Cymbomonas tetramitiformis]